MNMEYTKLAIFTIFSIILLGISLLGVTFSYFINKTGNGEKVLVVDNITSTLAYNMDSPVFVELR